MSESRWREAVAEALWTRFGFPSDCEWEELPADDREDWRKDADALSPVLAQMKREWQAEALAPIVALADEWADACYSPGVHTKCKGHALRRALAEASGQEGEL